MHFLIDYWYLTLALIVAIIVTMFVCLKASRAVRISRLQKEKIIAQLDYEKDLRQDFKALTDESFDTADCKRLLDGIGMNIQMTLEKSTDMNTAFLNLTDPKKYIYALYILMSESEKGLKYFFRANGKPLTPAALDAVNEIIGGRFFELFEYDYCSFDEDNEDFSLIKEDLLKVDKEFSALLENDSQRIYEKIANYIIANKAVFILA